MMTAADDGVEARQSDFKLAAAFFIAQFERDLMWVCASRASTAVVPDKLRKVCAHNREKAQLSSLNGRAVSRQVAVAIYPKLIWL